MKFFATATSSAIAILLTMMLSEAFAGVSVSVGEPGFYGQIDIGDYPPPQLYSDQAIIIQQGGPVYPPVYLYVPLYERRHWHRHCHRYNACGRPVYFIQDSWYNQVYVPRYREHHHISGPPPRSFGPRQYNSPRYENHSNYGNNPNNNFAPKTYGNKPPNNPGNNFAPKTYGNTYKPPPQSPNSACPSGQHMTPHGCK